MLIDRQPSGAYGLLLVFFQPPSIDKIFKLDQPLFCRCPQSAPSLPRPYRDRQLHDQEFRQGLQRTIILVVCQVRAERLAHRSDDSGRRRASGELLSNLVFEVCRSCGDLVGFCGFNSVFDRDACDDFGQLIKAA